MNNAMQFVIEHEKAIESIPSLVARIEALEAVMNEPVDLEQEIPLLTVPSDSYLSAGGLSVGQVPDVMAPTVSFGDTMGPVPEGGELQDLYPQTELPLTTDTGISK